MPRIDCKHFCGVLNVKLPDDEAAPIMAKWVAFLESLVAAPAGSPLRPSQRNRFTGVMGQAEKGAECGTNHVQFYFQLKANVNVGKWRKAADPEKDTPAFAGSGFCLWWQCMLDDNYDGPRPKILPCVGSSDHNITYCTKDDTSADLVPAFRVGDIIDIPAVNKGKGQGSRSDLEDVKTAIDQGASWEDVQEMFFGDAAKYHNFFRQYISNQQNKKARVEMSDNMKEAVLRPWQQAILDILEGPINAREILWVWEALGNVGKSWFAKYLTTAKNALILTTGKRADLIHIFREHLDVDIVIFDLSRTSEDTSDSVVYELAEKLKDGHLLATKYDSCSLWFKPKHVLVMANYQPNNLKLSLDRLKVHHVAVPGPN